MEEHPLDIHGHHFPLALYTSVSYSGVVINLKGAVCPTCFSVVKRTFILLAMHHKPKYLVPLGFVCIEFSVEKTFARGFSPLTALATLQVAMTSEGLKIVL